MIFQTSLEAEFSTSRSDPPLAQSCPKIIDTLDHPGNALPFPIIGKCATL
jgi:hypothetical protein